MVKKTTSYSSFSPINCFLSLPPPSSPSPPSSSLLLLLFCLLYSKHHSTKHFTILCTWTAMSYFSAPTHIVPAAWTSHIQFSLVLQSPSQMSLPQIKWPVAKTTFLQTLIELCCFLLAFDILILYSVYILSPLLDGNPFKRFSFVSYMAVREMLCSWNALRKLFWTGEMAVSKHRQGVNGGISTVHWILLVLHLAMW